MSKFKVGDKVVCMCDFITIAKGKIYKVIKIDKLFPHIYIYNDRGRLTSWSESNFELVKGEDIMTAKKCNCGTPVSATPSKDYVEILRKQIEELAQKYVEDGEKLEDIFEDEYEYKDVYELVQLAKSFGFNVVDKSKISIVLELIK